MHDERFENAPSNGECAENRVSDRDVQAWSIPARR